MPSYMIIDLYNVMPTSFSQSSVNKVIEYCVGKNLLLPSFLPKITFLFTFILFSLTLHYIFLLLLPQIFSLSLPASLNYVPH